MSVVTLDPDGFIEDVLWAILEAALIRHYSDDIPNGLRHKGAVRPVEYLFYRTGVYVLQLELEIVPGAVHTLFL